MTKKKRIILTAIVVILVMMFAFPGSKTNPEIEREIQWDSPQTKALFYRACADCHSNETKWPWYSNIAPVSWFVIGHVNHARGHFNISSKKLGEAHEAAEELEEGEMPLKSYLLMHPEAKLTPEEKKDLISGLKKTFGSEEKKDHKKHKKHKEEEGEEHHSDNDEE
jgi:hypothetical protein